MAQTQVLNPGLKTQSSLIRPLNLTTTNAASAIVEYLTHKQRQLCQLTRQIWHTVTQQMLRKAAYLSESYSDFLTPTKTLK